MSCKRLVGHLTNILPVTASTLGGNGLLPWPMRMNSPSSRLKELGFSNKTFIDDTVLPIISMTFVTLLSSCSCYLLEYCMFVIAVVPASYLLF